MQKTVLLIILMASCQAATAGLESPANDEIKSGIGLIRGWICDANEVSVSIDGQAPKVIAYGNPRGDTLEACGDTNNGFEALWNWNILGDGPHTITAYADGVEIDTNSFDVVTLGLTDENEEAITYARGLSGSYSLKGFPAAAMSTEVSWSEKDQNFVISEVSEDLAGAIPVEFNGVWVFRYDDGLLAQSSVAVMDGESTLVTTVYRPQYGMIEMFSGPVNGSKATVSTWVSEVDVTFDVELISENELSVTVVSCAPANECQFPVGYVLTMDRVE